ncbi:MAG: thioesterase family protein [Clostridiales bacterium]|nr:thioesterase family protein [Clostridiales bacterium]
MIYAAGKVQTIMTEYTHKVQYYETDKMGFVHHSNYIRWFEEARLDYMDQAGYPYKNMEDIGLFCPVLAAECTYKKSVCFGDTVKIYTKLTEYGNVRHKFSYLVVDAETGEERAEGSTEHCLLDVHGHVTSLKRKDPQLFEKFAAMTEE